MKESQSQSSIKKTSIFNALIIYGVVPVLIFVAFAFMDETYTLGLLDAYRVPAPAPSPSLVPKPPPLNSEQQQHQQQQQVQVFKDSSEHIQKVESKQSSSDAGREATGHQSKRMQEQPAKKRPTEEQHGSSIDDQIDYLRQEYTNDTGSIYKALHLAETFLYRDMNVHDGGSIQSESIRTFLSAIELIKRKRDETIRQGRDVHESPQGRVLNIEEDIYMQIEMRSMQGLLVKAYCDLGRQYYMASMFEKAVGVYNAALALEPKCSHALQLRASNLMILGRYDEAGKDYVEIMKKESYPLEIYGGITKILVAKENAIPNGWELLRTALSDSIPSATEQLREVSLSSYRKAELLNRLKVMYLALFSYHDHKSKDTENAWESLTMANKYKLAALPPYNYALEKHKVDTVQQIFQQGFWPAGVGSRSKSPIFIVGFPRSGSTLLERILDAHPAIIGTGEDSVFNGMLGEIRDGVVKASMAGSPEHLKSIVRQFADKVDRVTKNKWSERNEQQETEMAPPKRFVDKMLTNYVNVGFIHMLYPDALILHISREPMDCLYSSYKHDFVTGNLQYTGDFSALAHMYSQYRDLMNHWDRQLPGRVTHIRYEDIVHDMPGTAKAIIAATGLQWDDRILEFHKTKYVANTYSTTQVKNPIYKDSLQSWRRYEKHLDPLKTMLGTKYTSHSTRTTLRR